MERSSDETTSMARYSNSKESASISGPGPRQCRSVSSFRDPGGALGAAAMASGKHCLEPCACSNAAPFLWQLLAPKLEFQVLQGTRMPVKSELMRSPLEAHSRCRLCSDEEEGRSPFVLKMLTGVMSTDEGCEPQ